jgi:hypothetical protein
MISPCCSADRQNSSRCSRSCLRIGIIDRPERPNASNRILLPAAPAPARWYASATFASVLVRSTWPSLFLAMTTPSAASASRFACDLTRDRRNMPLATVSTPTPSTRATATIFEDSSADAPVTFLYAFTWSTSSM